MQRSLVVIASLLLAGCAWQKERDIAACSYLSSNDSPNDWRAIGRCLVSRYNWTPSTADRVALDTLIAVRLREADERAVRERAAAAADSLTAMRARAKADETRRRDSIWDAAHRERLNGPPVPVADSVAWVADRRTGALYLASCQAAMRIPVAARQYYAYQIDALAASRWFTRRRECR